MLQITVVGWDPSSGPDGPDSQLEWVLPAFETLTVRLAGRWQCKPQCACTRECVPVGEQKSPRSL